MSGDPVHFIPDWGELSSRLAMTMNYWYSFWQLLVSFWPALLVLFRSFPLSSQLRGWNCISRMNRMTIIMFLETHNLFRGATDTRKQTIAVLFFFIGHYIISVVQTLISRCALNMTDIVHGSTGKMLIEFMLSTSPALCWNSLYAGTHFRPSGQPWCTASFSGLNLGEQSIILCVFVVMPLDPWDSVWD